jgi:general stress protein YciG
MNKDMPQSERSKRHTESAQSDGADATSDSRRTAESTPGRLPAFQGSPDEARPRRPRGFAVMDRGLVREIARKGGKAAHAKGTAHEFTGEEARAAGRGGGLATHENRRRALGDRQPV